MPYAVKVHGSALEYTVRPHRERFLPYALEGIRGARGVLVGSRHTAESLWEVLADEPALPRAHAARPARRGRPHVPAAAPADLERLAGAPRRPRRPPGAARPARPTRCARSTRARDRIVSYVGKLIVSKGVDLLLAAWPLVVGARAGARGS